MKRLMTFLGVSAALVAAPPVHAAGVNVGFSAPSPREAMEAEVQKLGIEVRCPLTHVDAADRVAQRENPISRRIEVFILAPHDASSASVFSPSRAVGRAVRPQSVEAAPYPEADSAPPETPREQTPSDPAKRQ